MFQSKTFTAGNLVYTRMGIAALFGWLLWGDFVFNFMEIVVGNFLPLKLKYLDAPNWLIGLIITTIPSIMAVTIAPAISVASDRTRTRWGRRIPYLLITTPFVTATLILIGASDTVSLWLQHTLFSSASPRAVSLVLMGFFIVAFQFLNIFLTNIYGYLFNDVVPPEPLARFMALFKVVGITATSGF